MKWKKNPVYCSFFGQLIWVFFFLRVIWTWTHRLNSKYFGSYWLIYLLWLPGLRNINSMWLENIIRSLLIFNQEKEFQALLTNCCEWKLGRSHEIRPCSHQWAIFLFPVETCLCNFVDRFRFKWWKGHKIDRCVTVMFRVICNAMFMLSIDRWFWEEDGIFTAVMQ